jgi:hypothetical protein
LAILNQTLLALSPRLHVRHGEAVKDTGDLTKKISSEGRVFRIEILAKEVGSSSFGIAFTLTNRCFKDKNLKIAQKMPNNWHFVIKKDQE